MPMCVMNKLKCILRYCTGHPNKAIACSLHAAISRFPHFLSSMADQEIRAAIEALSIEFDILEHRTLPTAEDVIEVLGHLDGLGTKNLVLKDKKEGYFMVTAAPTTAVNMKELGSKLVVSGIGKKLNLRFADESILESKLKVARGSVSPFCVMHDVDCEVRLVLDKALVDTTMVHTHPARNDVSYSLMPEALLKFVRHYNHDPLILDFV